MSLPIGIDNFASRLDENLRIINMILFALGNSADNGDRKFLRQLLQARHRALSPGTGVLLNDWHGIAGVAHLGEDDQVSALLLGSQDELANLPKVGADLTRGAGDLSNC